MKKADRQRVFDKFGGRCAYCGCELQKGWHVDHIIPVRRGYDFGDKIVMSHPEHDNIDNMMPACASCNINKHSDTIENFRANIANYMKHLNGLSTQYKVAKRYGLINETGVEVKFYFETQIPNP